MKKNAIVGQSGGPTSVINASLYGVVYEALNREDVIGTIYGMINGIEGFLNENMMDMKPLEVNGELELIKTTPGSYLGSCRYKLPEDLTDAVYPQLFEKFEKYNIGYFFYIGGNDSMDTVSKLSRYAETVNSEIRFIGIPKTIDNDLVLTDHTPGFGSAAKYVASTVREIAIDASVYDNKNPLQSLRSWDVMPDGLLLPVSLPVNSKATIRFSSIFRKLHLIRNSSLQMFRKLSSILPTWLSAFLKELMTETVSLSASLQVM